MSTQEIITSIEGQLKQLQDVLAAEAPPCPAQAAELAQLREENAKLKRQLRQSEKHIKALQMSFKALAERKIGPAESAKQYSSQVDRQSSIDLATEETRLESERPDAREEHMSIRNEVILSSSPPIKEEPENTVLSSSQPAEPLNVLDRSWHPTDFIVNPDANEGLNFAFQEKVLGKKRAHLPSVECQDCKSFAQATGLKCTRHREKWGKQNTPPGFWRSDFDSLQERQDKEEAQAKAKEESKHRLEEALRNGQYLFRDATLRKKAKLGLLPRRS